MACSELAGIVKTGGLGDAVFGLATHLSHLGADVHVIIPGYPAAIRQVEENKSLQKPIIVAPTGGSEPIHISVQSLSFSSFTLHLVKHACFDRPGLYDDGHQAYSDNSYRFSLFCQAVLAFCQSEKREPDIIHCHDWHTALLPYYLRVHLQPVGLLKNTRTVLTIHNAAFQQKTDARLMNTLGLAWRFFVPDVFEDYGEINLLKCGIAFADRLTAVSPGYARELLTPEGSHGLFESFQRRKNNLQGILNGVETDIWNPEHDALIPACYHREDMSGKHLCKTQLLEQLELPCKTDTPVYGMVSRLTEQKGFTYLLPALEFFLSQKIACIILGIGEAWITETLKALESRYPDHLRFLTAFDDILAHRIIAGSDFTLMPSLFEPCGLNQMYSQIYGTLPVVRKTGGLSDTVQGYEQYEDQATGFMFSAPQAGDLLTALMQSLSVYANPQLFQQLQKNAMALNCNWQMSATEYLALYHNLLSSRDNP